MKSLALILVVLVGLLAASCGIQKPIVQTVTETKWRDTTVYVKIPVYIDKVIQVPLPVHDTLKVIEKVYVDKEGKANMKSVHKEKGIVAADISIKEGVLQANLYLKDSTILYNYKDQFTVEDSVKIYNAIKEKLTTTTVTNPPERYTSKFSKFTHWYFFITLLLLAGYIFYRVKTAWVKDLLGKIKIP